MFRLFVAASAEEKPVTRDSRAPEASPRMPNSLYATLPPLFQAIIDSAPAERRDGLVTDDLGVDGGKSVAIANLAQEIGEAQPVRRGMRSGFGIVLVWTWFARVVFCGVTLVKGFGIPAVDPRDEAALRADPRGGAQSKGGVRGDDGIAAGEAVGTAERIETERQGTVEPQAGAGGFDLVEFVEAGFDDNGPPGGLGEVVDLGRKANAIHLLAAPGIDLGRFSRFGRPVPWVRRSGTAGNGERCARQGGGEEE